MKKIIEVCQLSGVSVFVEMMFDDLALACGTAFYFRKEEDNYLVTNWHNLSGRNPLNMQPLRSDGGVPNRLKIFGRNKLNFSESIDSVIELNDSEGVPIWLEHPKFGSSVDVAALPLGDVAKSEFFDLKFALEDIDPFQDWDVEVGEQVFILGFPFGISSSHRLPVWKSATLASEPNIDIEGLPQILVDTATRQGMSGSPVVQYTRRPISISQKGKVFSRFRASFIGVYSGRILPKDHLEAQLGRVWKRECVEEVIEGKRRAGF
ncbi:MAG: trypsin-like peptidase domain-containing protein [Opitutales bacterium]|nr:trypsin-like peptidase domain-containing protein [Opitutales bacterium]